MPVFNANVFNNDKTYFFGCNKGVFTGTTYGYLVVLAADYQNVALLKSYPLPYMRMAASGGNLKVVFNS